MLTSLSWKALNSSNLRLKAHPSRWIKICSAPPLPSLRPSPSASTPSLSIMTVFLTIRWLDSMPVLMKMYAGIECWCVCVYVRVCDDSECFLFMSRRVWRRQWLSLSLKLLMPDELFRVGYVKKVVSWSRHHHHHLKIGRTSLEGNLRCVSHCSSWSCRCIKYAWICMCWSWKWYWQGMSCRRHNDGVVVLKLCEFSGQTFFPNNSSDVYIFACFRRWWIRYDWKGHSFR